MPEKKKNAVAVVDVAGKQYRVTTGQEIKVPSILGETGSRLKLEQVLLFSDGNGTHFGNPNITGATVGATLVRHGRDPKVTVFKFRRRKGYRKKTGHRQDYSILRVDSIKLAAAKPPATSSEKAAPPAKDTAAPKPKTTTQPKPKGEATPKKSAAKKPPSSSKPATVRKSGTTGKTAAPKKTGTTKKATDTTKTAAARKSTVKKVSDTKKTSSSKTAAKQKTSD